jgi:hypothetical protein
MKPRLLASVASYLLCSGGCGRSLWCESASLLLESKTHNLVMVCNLTVTVPSVDFAEGELRVYWVLRGPQR